MGACSSQPAAETNSPPSNNNINAAKSDKAVTPQPAKLEKKPSESASKPPPQSAPAIVETNKDDSPDAFISKLTKGKPLDAKDVIDLAAAKREIQLIRQYAQQFLDNANVNEQVDDDDDQSGKLSLTKQGRVALYEKEDLLNFVKDIYPKEDKIRTMIYEAIVPNSLFEQNSEEEIIEIIDVFKPANFKSGESVIKQGDQGELFYVVESGELSIRVTVGEGEDMSEVRVGDYGPGSAFGELALIFGSPRAATITASSDCKLWSLERRAYRGVTGQYRFRQHEEKVAFLREVEFEGRYFREIFDSSQIDDISIALKTDRYKEGDIIFRRGEIGDTFFIIQSGKVEILDVEDGSELRPHTFLTEKQFFGEMSLLESSTRKATLKAVTPLTVYYLTREDFNLMIGSMQDVLEGKATSRTIIRASSKKTIYTSLTMDQRYELKLEDLNFFNVLGQGAFGKVSLVQAKESKKVFALKAQSKYFIVKNGQAKHVLNEFRIMKDLDHPNILAIHCAMQDKKYLYFLLDLLPGGELMNYLTSYRKFTEEMTRFYAASVVLAFQQIHTIMIAYRDLKPENMVLDSKGYCILVDFGLAKEIEEGQTFTFCGTPDYLAPEVIRGTGHDWAVDYWGLGVLLFELTNGSAPFYAMNQARRTRKILKGYEFVKKPSHFSDGLGDIISNLLTSDQSKRLGRTQSGIQAVMNHRWFAGFDWAGLAEKIIPVPITPDVPADIKTLGKSDDRNNYAPESEWWPNLKFEFMG